MTCSCMIFDCLYFNIKICYKFCYKNLLQNYKELFHGSQISELNLKKGCLISMLSSQAINFTDYKCEQLEVIFSFLGFKFHCCSFHAVILVSLKVKKEDWLSQGNSVIPHKRNLPTCLVLWINNLGALNPFLACCSLLFTLL